MSTIYTLDASVFVAASRTKEPGHKTSHALISMIRDHGIPLIEPAILTVEIAGALSRTGSSAEHIRTYIAAIHELPRTTMVDMDQHVTRRAEDLAVRYRLRGADAIYAATAALYGARLVSLDREHLQISPEHMRAIHPESALKHFR